MTWSIFETAILAPDTRSLSHQLRDPLNPPTSSAYIWIAAYTISFFLKQLRQFSTLQHPRLSCARNSREKRNNRFEKDTMKTKMFGLLALATLAVTTLIAGAKNPMVGGQEMFPTKNIIQNAVNSADHTTLVAAVKAAGLVDTLQTPGPFTVFAPTNEAFAKLPAGTVENLLKPENKDMLIKVLTYHVVAGKLSAADLRSQIKAGNGSATLKTVSGGTLTAWKKGMTSMITIPNVFQSNGVIHVVDSVLLPN